MTLEQGEEREGNGKMEKKFQKRLDQILYGKVSPENILTFADDALKNLLALVADAEVKYLQEHPDAHLEKNDLEDEACKAVGLSDVGNLLLDIAKMQEEIKQLYENVRLHQKEIDIVLVPPSSSRKITTGSGQGVPERRIFPRYLTLMYILKRDFGLTEKDVLVERGTVTKDMMRQEPYVCVDIPSLNRVVYLCDEAGNVSYVFDTSQLKDRSLPSRFLDDEDKLELAEFIWHNPRVGISFRQTSVWRSKMSYVLGKTVDVKSTGAYSYKSEFREPEEDWVSYEDFVKEVRALYAGATNVRRWFKQERKSHPYWPSHPDYTYLGQGWEGWSELVDMEWPTYKEFIAAVRAAYKPEFGSVSAWYQKEYKKHPKWHSAPDLLYADSGWKSWPELVGNEKPDFLEFSAFKKEVQSVYAGETDALLWYRFEKKKHKNWPSSPRMVYADKGWNGFRDLVEKVDE